MSRQKTMLFVLVPFACQLIYLGILSTVIEKANDTAIRHARAERIVQKSNELSKVFYDTGVAMGGYRITKSPLFSDRYDKNLRQVSALISDLRKEVGGDNRQQQILANIERICGKFLEAMGKSKQDIDDNKVEVQQFRGSHMYTEVRSLADRLQEELHGLTEDEQKILQEPENGESARSTVRYFFIAGVVMNVLIACIGLLVARKS